MSNRYSVHLKGPDGEDFGAVQATKGQTASLFDWMRAWSDWSERRGARRGAAYAAATASLVYIPLLVWL